MVYYYRTVAVLPTSVDSHIEEFKKRKRVEKRVPRHIKKRRFTGFSVGPSVNFSSNLAMILKLYQVIWTLQSFLFIQSILKFIIYFLNDMTPRLEKRFSDG